MYYNYNNINLKIFFLSKTINILLNYFNFYLDMAEDILFSCVYFTNLDPLTGKNKIYKLDKKYVQQFWIGLLEGDGTITVDKPKKGNSLRVRFVISLLNKESNLKMLNLITKVIGGRVSVERKTKYVTWIANKKNDLLKILALLNKYPLITSRKQLQLAFATSCILNPNPKDFVKNRNNKYNDETIVKQIKDFKLIPYFQPWLSGFIEAEGNFNLILTEEGKIRTSSFNIGQNKDIFVLELIKFYFDSHHIVFKDKKLTKEGFDHYRISISGDKCRSNIKTHFLLNPLLGNKSISYHKWIYYFIKNEKNLSV
jgi:hypothetical protein